MGALDRETAMSLREAFAIDPAQLPPLARHELREAFRAVAHAQKRLSTYAPLGL